MKRAFTLVELLVVMVIVTILAALLLAGISAARRHARRTLAYVEIAQLEAAMKVYQFDWNRLPQDADLPEGWDSGESLVFRLGAKCEVTPEPKQPLRPWDGQPVSWFPDRNAGPYFEFPPSRLDARGRFIDPWGTEGRAEWWYQFDNNDEEFGEAQAWWDAGDPVRDPAGVNRNVTNARPKGVDIWSPGPDGVDYVLTAPCHVATDAEIQQFRSRCDDIGNW
jgi:prepilin-type N-terminal cleavage/methylation domain-containing protein